MRKSILCFGNFAYPTILEGRTLTTSLQTFAGSFAINPATGEPMPVWVADYVLGGYGSGAIMAVPAHDTRDYEFAEAFGLPIRHVVGPAEGDAPSPTADADGPFSGGPLLSVEPSTP